MSAQREDQVQKRIDALRAVKGGFRHLHSRSVLDIDEKAKGESSARGSVLLTDVSDSVDTAAIGRMLGNTVRQQPVLEAARKDELPIMRVGGGPGSAFFEAIASVAEATDGARNGEEPHRARRTPPGPARLPGGAAPIG